MLLHDVHLRKKEALKAETRGDARLAAGWRNNKLFAHLSKEESAILEQLADACEQEIAQQDQQARTIIERDKARYQGGQVAPGQTVQPPSDELYALQAQRNDIILRYRDQIRAAFGENRFALFRDSVQLTIAPNITSIQSAK